MRYLSTENAMTPRRQRASYTPEFRTQAVRMVTESSRPTIDVARELDMNEQTLSTWVSRYSQEHPEDLVPLSDTERARLTAAEKEVRDLRLELEFLKKAAAYFAKDHR